jgi:uridylate kinase
MDSIVIVMGGSVILSDDADPSFYKHFREIIYNVSKKYKIYIVVGGGKTARFYIKLGRKLGFTEEELDQIGISVTRVNAKFLSDILKNSNKIIPMTVKAASEDDSQIVVMGGTTPGHSTDMVGAELAEYIDVSKLIIATNVDGVYDKDPNSFDNAVKFDEIAVEDLINKYGTKWESAGKNTVIDGPALEIIQRSKIETFVLNGKNTKELENVVYGKNFNGTKIKV